MIEYKAFIVKEPGKLTATEHPTLHLINNAELVTLLLLYMEY